MAVISKDHIEQIIIQEFIHLGYSYVNGAFLFTKFGAFVITDYNEFKFRLKVLKKSRFWFSQKTISPKVIPIHVDNQNLGQGE
ncbi:MAG: hypothetical protein ACK469_14970 [Bacteroidota bacterium]